MTGSIFDYKKVDNFSIKLLRDKKQYKIFRVEFPSAYPTGIPVCDNVWGIYFRVTDSKKTIIVVHGISMISTMKYFCWRLATKGFSSFMVIMPYAPARIPKKRPISKISDLDWAEIFKRGLIQSVIDVRKTIDFLEKENNKIGIIGISLGTAIASIVQSIDNRILSGVYIVGGGDLANMLWDSRDFVARIYKRKLFRNITRQELALKWKNIDPLAFAKPASNVLMINARYDTSVKPEYTVKLWEALGKPEIRWLKCAHFFLSHLACVKILILNHFRRTLI